MSQSESYALFNTAIQGIAQNAIAKREEDDGKSPYAKSTGYVKRAVYELVRSTLKTSRVTSIDDALDHYGHRRAKTKILADNPFHRVYLALVRFGYDTGRTERRRIALELQYARRHRVPAHLLIGFIYQIGDSKRLEEWLTEPVTMLPDFPIKDEGDDL